MYVENTRQRGFDTAVTTRQPTPPTPPSALPHAPSLTRPTSDHKMDRGLKEPSLTRSGLVLYMPNPPDLKKHTEPNLQKPVGELCTEGDALAVTEKSWHDRSLSVILRFNKR